MEIAFAVTHYVKHALGKGRSTWIKNVFEFQSNGDHCYQFQNINLIVPNVPNW